MIRLFFMLLFTTALFSTSSAGKVTGTVTNSSGETLPFASVSVKNTKISTSANNQGKFFLELQPGTYTFVCRHVGYERVEKTVTVGEGSTSIDFVLAEQQVSLQEVVVKAGDEDPAYAIIRNAIRKRKEYQKDAAVYQCEVYSKGVMQLRDFPKQFMGQKVDFEDGDTSKRKMIYLSETISRLSVDKPDKLKLEVLSTRVSGQSDGFGFAGGRFFSFYENNIQISNALNPRGFVSPIAENALSLYRYKYEGAFFEEGQMIHKIKVMARRRYEPCFNGYINIVEDEWRIHSLQLQLTKESQMSFADTLRIDQLYQKLGVQLWVMQSQVLYPSVRFFGFDAYGSFANVYRKFELNPAYSKKFFDNTIIRYEAGSNKKTVAFWDTVRPLALTQEELKDYLKKDSLEKLRSDPAYLDSVDRERNKITAGKVLFTGISVSIQRKKLSYEAPSLAQLAGFNPVEGLVLDAPVTIRKEYSERKSITLVPHFRYGFSTRHLYTWATARYTFGDRFYSSISLSGGNRIFQWNNDNPIEQIQNTFSALLFHNNFMKIYAARYGRVSVTRGVGKGVTVNAGFQFQDRLPLEKRTDYSWNRRSTKTYTPNFPTELINHNFTRHQASTVTAGITFQPGARYIEFPDRTINIGSRWPVVSLQYTMGIRRLFGSDVDFAKWRMIVRDELNLKLAGRFSYRMQAGGFLNNRLVPVQDYEHLPGNRLFRSSDFMTRFQLPQYYRFSNKAPFYTAVFSEHHFNGFLTNKIPGFKKLNWHLVAGFSGVWMEQTNYAEWHVGLENIFRLFRFDIVAGALNGKTVPVEFRIGSRLDIGGSVD
jgi:hypothetical protein